MKLYFVIYSLFCISSIPILLSCSGTNIKPITCNISNCDMIPQEFPIPNGEYTLTNNYYDYNYYLQTGFWHTGVDLIPNANWYKDHPNQSVVNLVSTMYGKLIYAYSDCGGYAAIVENSEYIIYLGHIDHFLVKDGDVVTRNTPIAVMGNSGSCQTGKHVHFEIHHLMNGKWELVNPNDYN